MKKIHILIIFSGLSICFNQVLAQNWKLITPGEKHHFQHVNDTLPWHTILIDSAKRIGEDSIYYLNRFFLPCDTCTQEGYYLDNQPGFLQRELVLKTSGNQLLTNPESLFIQVTGTVGDTWWIDAQQTQLAEVSYKGKAEVFGVEDSTMHIFINNKEAIHLSKNHGLLKFYDYYLSGLEKANLGYCLPGFNEFHNFKVGDVFMYESIYGCSNSDHPQYCSRFEKKTITKIEKHEDTLKVSYNIKTRDFYFPYEGEVQEYNHSKTFINSPSHFANFYPNQKITLFNEIVWDSVYSFVRTEQNEFGLQKRIGGDSFTTTSNNSGPYLFNQLENGLFHEAVGVSHEYIFTENLGLSKYYLEYFEIIEGFNLIGAVIDGNTLGTVYSDSYMTSIKSNTTNKICIYPNPSKGVFQIEGDVSPNSNIKVFNLNGKQIHSATIINREINLKNIPNGIYILQISDEKQIEQIKWVKQE